MPARSLRSIAIFSRIVASSAVRSVIARADGKIEQTLEDRSVARRALQDGFQKIDRFLRQTIAGKQIDIGQGLRDVTLRFFLERRFGRRGNRRPGRPLPWGPISRPAIFLRRLVQDPSSRATTCICAAWFHLREFVPAIFRRWQAPWRDPPKFHTRTRAAPVHPASRNESLARP